VRISNSIFISDCRIFKLILHALSIDQAVELYLRTFT